jgi:hypothetical protein
MQQHSKLKFHITMMLLSGLLMSCTKSIPYKEVYKENVESKSSLDPDSSEYLFVGSSDIASQDSTGISKAVPYWQGQEKIVKFHFTEKTLQALIVNEEDRLKGNAQNDKILFEVPIDHVEYRCAMDKYKKCTNQEEKNEEINWTQKTKFIPDFKNFKTIGTNMLPVEMEQIFGTSCYTEASSQLLKYELTEDALNIQIQKSFRADASCLAKKEIYVSQLDDLSSQVVFHYSFTKMKKITTPNFKALNYPEKDQLTFGFFTTTRNNYDLDYNRSEAGTSYLLDHWDPNKKEIVYYMSDNFNKPGFEAIKKATQTAFQRVNNGLKAAGIDMHLTIKDPEGKQPGDVRNSMIVMVEDPIAAGPLGYGPTAKNPRTGEILSGRVAMYYGNFLQNIRYTYDEVVRDLRAEKNIEIMKNPKFTVSKDATQGSNDDAPAADADKKATDASTAGASTTTGKSAPKANLSAALAAHNKMEDYTRQTFNNVLGKKFSSTYTNAKSQSKASADDFSKAIQSKNFSKLSQMSVTDFMKATTITDQKSVGTDNLSIMSKYCNYPSELFPFNEIVRKSLQSKLGQDLKYWNDLNDKERQAVLDLLMPAVWVPTLVHELGHNLGLRHNFGGSEDKDNFYSDAELKAMGVTHAVPYSSVMDYGYSELNLLPTLGKYDIAALRFAYKRQVTVKDDIGTLSTVTLKDSIKEVTDSKKYDLKDYRYCTDEHVDVNPNCKRFDKGTNFTEIVQYLIKSYDDMYAIRNFRNGRENFSSMNNAKYMDGMRQRFQYIRNFMERYKSIKNMIHLDDTPEIWASHPVLKDIHDSAMLSAAFFQRVLETPDIHCVYTTKDKPTEISAIYPLSQVSVNGANCFKDAEEPDGYKLVGQIGKSFNDLKDPKSDNHFSDQIDVRGIWIDKMLAAQMLFNRTVGNSVLDTSEDNYLDILPMRESIATTIMDVLSGKAAGKDLEIKDANGYSIAKTDFNHQIYTSPAGLKKNGATHWIPAPLSQDLATRLGLPMQQTSFQEVLLKTLSDSMTSSKSHWAEDKATMSLLRVVKVNKAVQMDPNADGIYVDVGTTRMMAASENNIAQQFVKLSGILKTLDKLGPAQLQVLMNEKKYWAQEDADNAKKKANGETVKTVERKSRIGDEYTNIPMEIVAGYKAKTLPEEDWIDFLLTILPQDN